MSVRQSFSYLPFFLGRVPLPPPTPPFFEAGQRGGAFCQRFFCLLAKANAGAVRSSLRSALRYATRCLVTLVTATIPHAIGAQNTFSEADFMAQVRANHPIAKQAQLLNQAATAEIMLARGGFDPKLYADYLQKNFDQKTYFAYGEYGLKIPTWYGIEAKASYNTANGYYLSDENKLPKNGQAVLGISVPVLQGLMIDERRADLFKARQTININRAEGQAVVNELLFAGSQVYWKWALANQQAAIYKNALEVAEQRFRGIRRSYELGDRTAMDTLESATQVQDRQIQYNDASFTLYEATLKLQNFVWKADAQPDSTIQNKLPENLISVLPSVSSSAEERASLLNNLPNSHPSLLLYQQKIAQLDIDLRLKREKIKPKLQVEYNLLGNGLAYNNLFTDNYKWGIRFSSPTLFRAERAGVQLSKIKIENTQWMQEQKTLEIQNKLREAFAAIDNIRQQLETVQQQTDNYEQLLRLENIRFELGESTFFLINSREMKFLESKVKLAKLQSELRIAEKYVLWAQGKLL